MTSSGLSLIELRERAQEDPTASEAVELIERLLKSEKTRPEARELCFKFLSQETDHLSVRLMLAQSYYLDGLGEFCARELEQIRLRGGKSGSLIKLLDTFSHFLLAGNAGSSNAQTPDTQGGAEEELAEIDFESDFTDALEDLIEEDEDDS